MKWCVYMVECADGTYYTGATKNLERRLTAHNAGQGAKYLRGRRPVRLVYAKAYRNYQAVLRAEWRIKQRTRQEKETFVRAYADRCR